ncbi:hypothetical protein BDD43_5601 [Mucilaginibacter gracilis]|uniref:Uncharacterized protein n=1 Tax=Mucilaginibacter gracilis TaxID=423350 RepID=A0A495JAE7_9SPHI|nr:hypothetical protein [Mucilaginibacter gracilis]RKR85332.1 hypothetical protein BDD43_5601 [Mucilaginibacter gracilis]
MLIDKDKELKQAVLDLSVAEKDKLLLKLISKDVVLMEQLRYKLIDSKDSDNARFERTKEQIIVYFERIANYVLNLSPGELMMELRYLSGFVNDYHLITKDKIGEVELRLLIFERLLNLKLSVIKAVKKHNQKLLVYLAGRLKHILEKYSKLHEDHQFDLKERFDFVFNNPDCVTIKSFM